MVLYICTTSERLLFNHEENDQKQYDDSFRNQHNDLVHLFDTDYAALCGFHEAAYAVLLKKKHMRFY